GQSVLKADRVDPGGIFVFGLPVRLEAGPQPLEIDFLHQPGEARMEFRWQSAFFRFELPAADRFGHLPDAARPAAPDVAADAGRFLFEERGCVNCHRPADSDKAGRTLLARPGPDLTKAGGRAYAGWLYQWLLDPAKLRPAT